MNQEGSRSGLVPLQDRRKEQHKTRFSKKNAAWALKALEEGKILDAFYSPEAYNKHTKRWHVALVTTDSVDFEPNISIAFYDDSFAAEFAESIQRYRKIDTMNAQRKEEMDAAIGEQKIIYGGAEITREIAEFLAEARTVDDQAALGDTVDGDSFQAPLPPQLKSIRPARRSLESANSLAFARGIEGKETPISVAPILERHLLTTDEALGKMQTARQVIRYLQERFPAMVNIEIDPTLDSSGIFDSHDDKIVINPLDLESPFEVESTIIHEFVGHRSIHALLGSSYQDTMLAIYDSLGPRIKKFMEAYDNDIVEGIAGRVPDIDTDIYNFDFTTREGKIGATEEYIAIASEFGIPDMTIWESIVAMVRQWMRKIGLSNNWTHNDVQNLIKEGFKKAELPMNSSDRRTIRQARYMSRLKKIQAPLHRRDLSFPGTSAEQLAYLAKMVPAEPAFTDRGKDLLHGFKKGMVQNIFDSLEPIAKQLGMGAYKLTRLAKRKDGVLMAMLQFGGLKVNASTKLEDLDVASIEVDESLPGFFNSLKPLGTESERVRYFSWLAANRANKLRLKGKEKWLDPDEIDAGMTLNEGSIRHGITGAVVNREQLYDDITDDFTSYNSSIIDIGVKFGVFDKKTARRWEKQFYVPFWREIERQVGDTRGLKGPVNYKNLVDLKSPVYELKGADMKLKDPFNNIIQNWGNILDASLKNQAGYESLKVAETIVNPITGEKVAERKDEATNRSVHVLVNGKKKYYHINNDLLFDALSSVHQSDIKIPGGEWMTKAKRLLTLGITSSPDFKIRNAIRDSITAMGTTGIGANVVNNFFGGYKSLQDREFKGRMLASGGYMQFGFMHGDDKKMAEKMFKREQPWGYILGNKQGDENLRQAMGKYGNILSRVVHRYQDWGDSMENANRASLFKKVANEGKSDLEAAYHARDVLDFSMNGKSQWIRFAIATIPFANALLQSKYKTYRGYKDHRSAFYGVALSVVALSLAEYEMYGDDEEWRAREEWDKDTYFWFKIPGTDTAFRIPKPHEFSILGNMAWRMIDAGLKDDPVTKELMTDSLARVFKNEFYFTPVPQFISPIAELIADKDFHSGRPIEGLMKEFASPSERRRLYTSDTAVAASREIFDKMPIESFRLSPIQIEHLIKGYTGFLGEGALFVSDLMVSRIYDTPKAPARRITDYPVLKSFFQKTPVRNTMYGNIIYQHFKTIEQAYSDISIARRVGDIERAEELTENNRDKIYWNDFIKANKGRMADISTRIKQTRNSRYMNPEAKRQEIERLEQIRNLIAKQTVETVLR